MKHITYDGNSWLVDDAVADAIVDYAVLLAQKESADSLEIAAINDQGDRQFVTLLIGPATMMTVERSTSELDPPDNTDPIARVRERIRQIVSPPSAMPGDPGDLSYLDDLP